MDIVGDTDETFETELLLVVVDTVDMEVVAVDILMMMLLVVVVVVAAVVVVVGTTRQSEYKVYTHSCC